MDVVITGGGTVEPVDEVRVLTNRSTGSLATDLARSLAGRGHDVRLLLGELARGPEVPDGVDSTRFGDHEDLMRRLRRAVRAGCDLCLHAAAVADYAPEPIEGKIASGADELRLVLRPTPKIIDRLAAWGDDTFLVGWKLVVGEVPDELPEAARALIDRSGVHLVCGNELRAIEAGEHRLHLFSADGHEATYPRDPVDDLATHLVRSAEAWRAGPG